MATPSYIQLLAQQDEESREGFDENAKDLLVEQREYEDDVEAEDHHPEEIENQEDFRKFGGSHQQASNAAPPPKFQDLTKLSVSYQKQIKTHVINVDSRYRDNPRTPITLAGAPSTDFLWRLPTTIKNVISVRLSSVELPNTSYDFSREKGNVDFNITLYGPGTPKNFTLPSGNYTDVNDLVDTMNILINGGTPASNAPQGGFGAGTFLVSFDTVTGKLTIANVGGNLFSIVFVDTFPTRPYDWGLGYNLGFNGSSPSGDPRGFYGLLSTGRKASYTGETIVDLIGPNYFILKLDPDWIIVQHHGLTEKYLSTGIAKVIVNVPKNALIYDNGSNTVFKEVTFKQPTNITTFPVQVMDPYGEVVDLEGANFSFTLEVIEALNPSLYEHLRN